MQTALNRRHFLGTTAFTSLSLGSLAIGAAEPKPTGTKRPIVISSGGLKTVEIAMEMIKKGPTRSTRRSRAWPSSRPIPTITSVGLGGTPNEEGVVELDAAVMHGPTHGGAGVAGLRNIVHPAAVARTIMKKTRHVLIVGDNALKFAKEQGFPEIDLTTEETRKAWLAWKESRLRDNRYRGPAGAARPGRPRPRREARPRHDPLLGPRYPRRHGLRDHHIGAGLQGPRPGRRLADPGGGHLSR